MKLRYTVNGTAADGQTYEVAGTLSCQPGDFVFATKRAMQMAFMELTQGKAVFGKPGLGCSGPYTVTRLLVEEIPEPTLKVVT